MKAPLVFGLALSLSWAELAWANAPSDASESQDSADLPATAEEQVVPPPGPSAPPAPSVSERRQQALSAFDTGQVDPALDQLRDLLRECLALPESECDLVTRSLLYRDAGVVLAQGKSDHTGAVRVLRHAIRADRNVSIPEAYRTPKVNASWDEARRIEGLPVVTPAVVPVAPAAAPATLAPEPVAKPRQPNILFHGVANLKVGGLIGNTGSEPVGQLGLEVLTAHVGRATGAFAGGLLHTEYKWFLDNGANWGAWGLAGAFGGTFGRNRPSSCGYLMGGIGFVHWPDVGRAGFALHARYGASLKGFGLGLGADLSHVPFSTGSVTEILFGIHMGFARLL